MPIVTGAQVIDAIIANDDLMAVGRCPAVSVEFGTTLYGHLQNDKDDCLVEITNDASIEQAIMFSGEDNYTQLFHLSVADPVHHFVIMPWVQKDNGSSTVYTVFMAYEAGNAPWYTVNDYRLGAGNAPPNAPHGFKMRWTKAEIVQMLRSLRNLAGSRTGYFGAVGTAPAATINCWRYPMLKTSKALGRL